MNNETWNQCMERLRKNREKRIAECTNPEERAAMEEIHESLSTVESFLRCNSAAMSLRVPTNPQTYDDMGKPL
jgi:hypothetical protein